MKGYLKSAEGVFQLAPKVTTVGREGCDLVCTSPGIDQQHALIEYSEQEDCFVLQDLNTAQGTYINDCRVQNAAVRLAPRDIITFGFSGSRYELEVDRNEQMMYPPVQHRPAWTQPLTVISDVTPPQVTQDDMKTLPHLKTTVNTTFSSYPKEQTVLPHPPSTLRGRPLSAGAVSRKSPAYPEQRSIVGSGWVTGRATPPRAQTADTTQLQEKEQRILKLSDEVKRLSAYESECLRKDDLVRQLREEISEMHGKLRAQISSRSPPAAIVTSDAELTQKLLQLENEVTLKKLEVQSLKEQIVSMKETDFSGSAVNRQELNERVMEINSLRAELERVRKDKNITSGLVSQMQKDMTNKDTTISRLTRDLEAIKCEVGDKDIQLSSLQSKFRRTQEMKQTEAENEARDVELATLKQLSKSSEERIEDQKQLIASLREELEKVRRQADEDRQNLKQNLTELDVSRSKCVDVERSERQVRVDLEQANKQLQRFRNRVLQTTFSTPGIKAPDKELPDDELLEALKAVMSERTEMLGQVKDAKDKLKASNMSYKDVMDSSKKMKSAVSESVSRLRERGLLSGRLRQEVDLLGTVSLDETMCWARSGLIDLLNVVTEWETQIEAALEESGVNVKISEDEPWKHILQLHSVHEEQKAECCSLRARLLQAEEQHKEELQTSLDALRAEHEERGKDRDLQVEIDYEEKLKRAREEIQEGEAEKLEAALEAESKKYAELEASLVQIKTSLLDKEEEMSANKEAAREALESVESFKAVESLLREQLAAAEKALEEERGAREADAQVGARQTEESSAAYKEQIRQHAVTICTLEERLNKVVKKNKDYQSEVASLKKNMNELKTRSSRPASPPKPKVIIQRPAVDVAVLEQTLAQTQRQLTEAKAHVQEQQDVITGLRRDLAGATARLSDMTGELSEAQKEEMERNRGQSRKQEAELTELRQQMVKLSQIIDNQSSEITDLNNEIAKQRASLSKYKHIGEDQHLKIQDLEAMLTKEKDESKKHLSLLEEEGRITSELTALGAQCRGDRHEQVISRQREALTELRARIKALEQERPPLPTHDQALQQVVLLQKELAKLRASQAMDSTAHITNALSSTQQQVLQQQINKARGIEDQGQAEIDMERSAHRETIEALEASEGTYLALLRNMAASLELDDIAGLRSMAHIPRDERINLAAEREAAVQLLVSRVKVINERIKRKDELLQGYERDLAKLRQAEKIAEHKSMQMDSLVDDVRYKTEESQYLRESLNKTRDRLDQEKRLNSAVKSKKTFHLERENVSRNGWPRHRCLPEDIMGEEKAKKKHHSEKVKRKNYEIRTLKGELSNRDRDLHGARRRIIQLENTMDMETDRDILEPPAVATH